MKAQILWFLKKSQKIGYLCKTSYFESFWQFFSFLKNQHASADQTKHAKSQFGSQLKSLGMCQTGRSIVFPVKKWTDFLRISVTQRESMLTWPSHSDSINWLRAQVMVLLVAFSFPILGLAVWAVSHETPFRLIDLKIRAQMVKERGNNRARDCTHLPL